MHFQKFGLTTVIHIFPDFSIDIGIHLGIGIFVLFGI